MGYKTTFQEMLIEYAKGTSTDILGEMIKEIPADESKALMHLVEITPLYKQQVLDRRAFKEKKAAATC